MIKAIFYCQFLPRQGPTVLHQVPENSISISPTTTTTTTTTSSSTSSSPPPLLSFPPLSTHLIPRHEFCNRPLTILSPPPSPLRIISHPTCIHDSSRYERNDFIFNFAIVVDAGLEEWGGYRGVVRRLAGVWRGLEEWGGVLSGVGGVRGRGDGGVDWGKKVFAMMEQVLEDLNNYCECMIPIDESTTVNIKLFPKYPPPPPVKPYHVPISTVQLDALMDVNWDLTMQKIIPHINGLNPTSRLSALSSSDPTLVKKCLSHLLYYNCLLMVDIFQFSAIYAVTAEISLLVTDKEIQEECAAYIASTPAPPSPISTALIISLYASLRQGLTLKAWCMEHERFLEGIDVRRFISFGIIKGFLYRVHQYAVKTFDASPPAMDVSAAVATGKGAAGPSVIRGGAGEDDKRKKAEQLPLMAKYLDGTHCLDEICTDLGLSEKEVLSKLRAYGDVQIIHK